jgi:magnesium transporter
MAQFLKRFHKPGTSPGTLRPPEVRRVEKVTITVMDYGPESLEEKEVSSVEETFPYRDTPTVTWINVNGLHDVDLLQKFGEHFGFHPLALEDVLNTGQRPKIEDYDDHEFIVVKELRWQGGLEVEQISMFLGRRYVITLQEFPGDPFNPVRERIRKGKGRIRKMGPDYLAYALIDATVDEFFPILEKFGERIEDLEAEVVENPTRETLQEIHRVKRELLIMRRAAWPEREVINGLQRGESHLIRKETKIYLRDCYDHTIQIMDMIETYRDLTASMMDVYLSSISNRMNEIMKVLTIIATIFIPLTFIVGVYGMNFNPESGPWNMPELNWYWGYPVVWLVMLVIALGLLYIFWKREWL